jgi:hypothetical protein
MHTRHSVDLWVSIVAAIGSLREREDKMGKGTDTSRQHLATKHTLCKSIEPSVLQNPFFGLFFHGPTLNGAQISWLKVFLIFVIHKVFVFFNESMLWAKAGIKK